MAAHSTGAPDLGLDLGKIPDLTDPKIRKRLSPMAIEAFFRILEKWNIRAEDGMALLGGVSRGRYYGLRNDRKGVLTQDELTRVSLLIGIFKALNILFAQKLADEWIRRPNSNTMFQRSTPLTVMMHGGVPAMLSVRRLLDARRGGR